MLYSNPRINRSRNAAKILMALAALIALGLHAEFAKGKNFVEVEGKVTAGVESSERMGRSDYSGKIKLKSKRNELGIRAVVGARGEAKKSQIVMTDALIDAKLTDQSNLRFGVMERKFGLAAEQSGWTANSQSELARKMKDFGFESRALQFKLLHDDGDKTALDFALGHNNALDVFVTTHFEYVVLEGWFRVGGWALLQSDRIDNGFQKVGAASLALWSDHAQWRYSLEVLGGKDPTRSEFEWLYGNKRSVYFGALTMRAGYAFALSDMFSLAPLFGAACITADKDRKDLQTFERQFGLLATLGDDLMFGLYYFEISRNRPFGDSKIDDQRYSFEVTYEF